MGLWEHFPYTNFHNLNLDWIVTKVKELNQKVTELDQWAQTHQGKYEVLLQRVNAIETEIDTFETQIRSEFDQLKAQQRAEFDALKAETTDIINREVTRLENEVNKAIAELENDFNQLLSDVTARIRQMEYELNQAIINLNKLFDANNQYMMQWVENRLQKFIDSLPEILTVMVYNPVQGQVTDIQQAVNDLYTVACYEGITAAQYDSLQLTASEYDALELTAAQYDQYGYKLLGYPDPDLYMISPFTGETVLVKDVVTDLAHLHMGGISAADYDALELKADEYDAKELTAFNYDWFADELLHA